MTEERPKAIAEESQTETPKLPEGSPSLDSKKEPAKAEVAAPQVKADVGINNEKDTTLGTSDLKKF